MLAAKLESGAKRVKRSFGRNIPFEAETRSKRQAVSAATLPKLASCDSLSASPDSPKPAMSTSPTAAELAALPAPRPVYVHESRLPSPGSARAPSGDDSASASSSSTTASSPSSPSGSMVSDRALGAEGAPAAANGSGKRVQFTEGAKTWNGLRRDRHFLDQLLHEFFVLGRQFASVDVLRLTGLDASLVAGVHALLEDLCARVMAGSSCDEDGVPVLLEGGGRGMKVSLFHHPYLMSLKRVVAEAEQVAALKISVQDDNSSSNQESPQEECMQKKEQQQLKMQLAA